MVMISDAIKTLTPTLALTLTRWAGGVVKIADAIKTLTPTLALTLTRWAGGW